MASLSEKTPIECPVSRVSFLSVASQRIEIEPIIFDSIIHCLISVRASGRRP